MNRPKTINIGGHETIIRIGEKDEFFNRTERLAEFDKECWSIHVKSGMSESWTNQIIVHEIIHALFNVAQIEGVDDALNEKLTLGLENHLYRMLIDNDLGWFRPQVAQG